MRIAFVSPYSWTFPGGVNRHIEELSEALEVKGHETRIFAPWDPDDRITKLTHRRRATRRERPSKLIPLGRTVGIPMNGAVSNISVFPRSSAVLRNSLREGYDVVHIHEPIAPVASWDAMALSKLPTVATFHTYSSGVVSNTVSRLLGGGRLINKLHGRIAVSEAARWTGRRFFGGDYRVVPNGVDLSNVPRGPKSCADRLRILFVGRSEERKGLPVLISAVSALREHMATELTVVGSESSEVDPLIMHGGCDPADVRLLGRLPDDRLWQELHRADIVCAPSLGGESFGMILIEAQAAGTAVVCSDIAGYRDVVDDGRDAVLVPPGKPADLALALESLGLSPERRRALGEAGRISAQRFDWSHVADQVTESYEDAIETHARAQSKVGLSKLFERTGLRPSGGQDRIPARRLPSLDPAPERSSLWSFVRRAALAVTMLGGIALAFLALKKIGVDSVVSAFVRSSPSWVLLAVALMALSPLLRASAWQRIVREAIPGKIVRWRDILRATLIGILMSATLPARLGEPSRALVVARRIGRPRENLPAVIGTLVSQTLLNLLALVILAAMMVFSIGVMHRVEESLLLISLAPAILVGSMIAMPAILRSGSKSKHGRVRKVISKIHGAMVKVRAGLNVFRKPKAGLISAGFQLSAWVLQWLACYTLFFALGLDGQVGLGAAAAVLFAVNVTAAVPATPSNIGVFQAAVVAVLAGAYGVDWGSALAYGIVLQAVELVTALVMGIPALMGEGLSWRDVRARTFAAAPVELPRREKQEPVAEEI